MNHNLFARLEAAVTAPDSVAVEAPGRPDLTYRQLFDQAGRFANALAGFGVAPGDRVVAQVGKSVEAMTLYLAVVRLGAVFVPLNTAYTAAEIEYFLTDAEPALFVCDPADAARYAAMAAASGARLETLGADRNGSIWDAAATQPASFATVHSDADSLAAMLYTSGTTGRSKGAMLSHDNLVSNALTLIDYWRFTPADRLIHALPIFHTHGLFVAINVTLFSGASMIFLPRFDADEIIALLPRATCLMGVPTFYVRLLGHPGLDAGATRAMRLFISGSAPLLEETHNAWQQRTGHAILERYGMTETNMNTSNPYDGRRVPATVGFPLPGVSLRITDPTTAAPLAQGEVGMIEVKGPNVFQGYWRMPEKTAADLRSDGFFITGDLGKVDADGYVHIVGRQKDLIITGGYNVYPKEVEEELDAMDGVLESAVVGIPDADFGEAVVAVVVRRPGSDLGAEQITAQLKARLARFKQPKFIAFIDDLPRNAMGKVQKQILRERATSAAAPAGKSSELHL